MVQGSCGDTDPEKRLVDTVGGRAGGTNGESSMFSRNMQVETHNQSELNMQLGSDNQKI